MNTFEQVSSTMGSQRDSEKFMRQNEFTRQGCQMRTPTISSAAEVAERRSTIAHGETVGINAKQAKPRTGRKKFPLVVFCRPCQGLKCFGPADPRFHRGLRSAAPPALGRAGFEFTRTS